MPIGYGFLILALVATVAANVLFTLSTRAGQESLALWGKRAALLSTGAILGAAAYLMQLIATHQFQVAYVAEYSARRSSAWYLLAAFWGGQEGSILLWASWSAVLGAILALRSGKPVGKVWPLFGILQLYLLALLLLKCPFKLGVGPVPLDGRGLNPLLENQWMIIHPPMLFLGFASTAIPAVWAVYGLLYRDWDGWAKASFSWVLFSFASLGLGLSLGGYWAYETLGWGGFWAWDPVENSSLVPWLFLTALLHGIPAQLKTGQMRPGNFLLGFLPFAAMNYGTFLTRTGLLSDFSVHSFSSLGREGYLVMFWALMVQTFLPLGLLIWRWRQLPKAPAFERVLTREYGFFLAALVLGLLGLLTLVGMSAPLFTKLAPVQKALAALHIVVDPQKGAAAPASFYDQAGYPLAILLTLLMAATPYLAFKNNVFEHVGKKLFPSYIAAIGMTLVLTVSAMYLGVRKPWMVLLFATSMFATLSNLVLLVPRLRHSKPRKTIGGFVAHMGAGMTLAGVACLVAFSRNFENVELRINEPRELLGYKLTYLGNSTHPFDRDGNRIRIRVEKGGRAWESQPRYYFAPWNGKDELFGNPPAIHRRFWGDLYIAHAGDPGEALDDPKARSANSPFSLAERQPRSIGEYTFQLMGLSLDDASMEALKKHDPKALDALPETKMSALVSVIYEGKETLVKPVIRQERHRGMFSEVVPIPGPAGKNTVLRFMPPPSERELAEAMAGSRAAIEAAKKAGAPGSEAFRQALMQSPEYFHARELQELSDFKKLRFETFGASDPDGRVFISVGTRPLIWLVWLGTLLFSLGGFVAYRRRALEQGIFGPDEAER